MKRPGQTKPVLLDKPPPSFDDGDPHLRPPRQMPRTGAFWVIDDRRDGRVSLRLRRLDPTRAR